MHTWGSCQLWCAKRLLVCAQLNFTKCYYSDSLVLFWLYLNLCHFMVPKCGTQRRQTPATPRAVSKPGTTHTEPFELTAFSWTQECPGKSLWDPSSSLCLLSFPTLVCAHLLLRLFVSGVYFCLLKILVKSPILFMKGENTWFPVFGTAVGKHGPSQLSRREPKARQVPPRACSRIVCVCGGGGNGGGGWRMAAGGLQLLDNLEL